MTRPDRVGVAAGLAAVAGSCAIVAGVVQAALGSRIPDWTGSKDNPVALGLLTTALGVSVVAAARALRAMEVPRSKALTAITLWLVVVALVCSTTVGRLWAVPGVLMVAAAGVTVAECGVHRFRRVVVANSLRGLLGLLGGFEILMAVSAAPIATVVVGLVGGAGLIAAAVVARPGRRAVVVLLVAMSLPFAALTWWTIVTPVLTAVAAGIGLAATARRPTSGGACRGARPDQHPALVT